MIEKIQLLEAIALTAVKKDRAATRPSIRSLESFFPPDQSTWGVSDREVLPNMPKHWDCGMIQHYARSLQDDGLVLVRVGLFYIRWDRAMHRLSARTQAIVRLG